jgi:hypothetical protein
LALAVVSASFTVGCFTTVWDGAEAHHTRISLGFYKAGGRVPHTPMAMKENIPWDQFYYSDVLWPYLLSKLWLLAGRPSHVLAQFYQAVWLFGLLIGVYCLSRLYYDPWVSLLAMCLTISTPMVPAFGTLFLVNIPVMALTVWALYTAHKLKHWPAVFALGLLVGCIYLTKRLNVAFFPAIILIGFAASRQKWQERLIKLAMAAVVAGGLIGIDLAYRTEHFNSRLLIKQKTPESYSIDDWAPLVKNRTGSIYEGQSLLRWKDTFLHLGPFVPLAFLLYILGGHYQWRDMVFIFLAAFYSVAFIVFMLLRYALPTIPIYYLPSFILITAPGGKALKKLWRWRIGRIGLFVCGILAVIQLTLVFQEVHKRRQLPTDIAEAYKYIRESIPDDGKVFLCSGFGLELHTGRVSTLRSVVPRVFFQPSTSWETRARVLDEFNIGYIIYREECTYDDKKGQIIWDAPGGMPRSFFEALEPLEQFQLVFKNDSVAIWKLI